MKPARQRSERSCFGSGFGPVLVRPGGSCGVWGGGRALGRNGGSRGRRRPAPAPSWRLNIKLQLQGTPQGLAVFFFLGGGQWGAELAASPCVLQGWGLPVAQPHAPCPPRGVFHTPRGVLRLCTSPRRSSPQKVPPLSSPSPLAATSWALLAPAQPQKTPNSTPNHRFQHQATSTASLLPS